MGIPIKGLLISDSDVRAFTDGAPPNMRIINIALLGSGFVAEFFMQGLANVNGQRVVVNYSRSRKRAQEFARRWNIPESVTQLKKAVERSDIDLYLIALPNEEHLPASSAAGKPQKEPGLYQTVGAQSARGTGDARGGQEIRNDPRLCRNRSVCSSGRQGKGNH